MVALEYNARANDILALCPPLRLMPLAPISVNSPSGSISRSFCRAHTETVLWYLAISRGKPNKTLSLIVAFSIHGICATNAMAPSKYQLLALAWSSKRSFVPPRMSDSPRMEARRRLFPDPVLPDITLSSLLGNSSLRFRRQNRSSSPWSSSTGQAIVAPWKQTVLPTVVDCSFSAESRYFSILVALTLASR